ncbi:hypothetical protein B0H13DRAFT_1941320 [Mycena leptocephala]|nr:hypothetical protein B0H13DRAFT_1941320 [Mycena leptocephala]
MNSLGRKASLMFLPDSHTAKDSSVLVPRQINSPSTPCLRPSGSPARSPTGTTTSLIASLSRHQASLTGSAEDRPKQPTTAHTIISLNVDDLEDYGDMFTLLSQGFLDSYWLHDRDHHQSRCLKPFQDKLSKVSPVMCKPAAGNHKGEEEEHEGVCADVRSPQETSA